jgi:hypothetical protein
MMDRHEASALAGSGASGVRPQASDVAADRERLVLIECRLEQVTSALKEARVEADRSRARLAEAAAREADHARRSSAMHEELAAARAEVAAVHRRLEHSEALRAELEGHLFESGARGEGEELIRLRREVLAERERASVSERSLGHLRARVDELVTSRETLLARVVEWQHLVRGDDRDAVDLAGFISELRRDILELERRNAISERREAALRQRLAGSDPYPDGSPSDREAAATPIERPGIEPPPLAEAAAPGRREARVPESEGSDALVAEVATAEDAAQQAALLLRLGSSGDAQAFYAIRPWAAAADPLVRAAAYEAMGRLLERDPSQLEPVLRSGLADSDARVRRRVVLSAATARGLDLRALLDPLRSDPDPQLRRVVHEVLRRSVPAREAVEAAR